MILSKKMSYLCIMKNENDMDTILKERGFILSENPNTYWRGNWTIIIDGDDIEAYTINPIQGQYPFVHTGKANLCDVLDDIDLLES